VTAALLILLAAAEPTPTAPVTSVVQKFYAIVIKDHPIGIPTGPTRDALWPFLSRRLAEQLDLLQACEDDYCRRNRRVLNPEPRPGDPYPPATLKPTIGWLEYGLFSGGNERVLPAEISIRGVDAVGRDRFRVRVQFTYRDTFETYGRPPDDSNTFRWPGVVVVVREEERYAIDDYLPVDEESGRALTALSDDFKECKAGRWVGLKGQRY
jgi:hypothetical protein